MLAWIIAPVIGLLSWVVLTTGYPIGAPPGICSLDMSPKHGDIPAQTTPLPYEIYMSKDRVTSLNDQIIVTIKSRPEGPAFKGFLVLAKDKDGAAIGTWNNDDKSHPLQGCSGTTHDNNIEKREVNLVWKPQEKVPEGPVIMKATIVQRFDVFWVKIPVLIKGESDSPIQQTTLGQTTNKVTDLPTSTISLPNGGVALPGLATSTPAAPRSIPTSVATSTAETTVTSLPTSSTSGLSTFKVLLVETTSTPSSSTSTTAKERSLLDKLLGRGKSTTTSSSSTTSAATVTTVPTTITTVPTTKIQNIEASRKMDSPETTTVLTTTSVKPGLLKRLFGGK